MGFLAACALGLALGLLWLWSQARAAITIAVLDVRDGQIRVTRGGLAPRVLRDLRDVAERPPIAWARVRVTRAGDHARVEVQGRVEAPQVQRIRNVIGSVGLAQLRNAPRR